MKRASNGTASLFLLTALVAGSSACKKAGESDSGQAAPEDKKSTAIISIDGSSTVYPITEAVAEEFRTHSSSRVTIGVSGTGGGFKKFCKAETAITGASRPIKPSEVELCTASKVEYIELPVAYDGLSVVVSQENKWAESMTVEELKKVWAPEAQGKISRWSQVREGWPDEELHLFGAGVDSGTYDYFTKAIVGKEHSSRGDFTSSEDDNVLVQGIATDRLAMGFFGYAYYAENKSRLKVLAVDDSKDDNGKGPIAPSPETVSDGTYQPLSRPVFVYVSKAALERKEVADFMDFYVANAAKLSAEVGYIALPAAAYQLVQQRLSKKITGSLFEGEGSKVGVTVEKLLANQG